jgi:hypothetical protein
MVQPLTFPLFERAVEHGVLERQSALIVAPTATGKSFIGCEVIRSARSASIDSLFQHLEQNAFLQPLLDRQFQVLVLPVFFNILVEPDVVDGILLVRVAGEEELRHRVGAHVVAKSRVDRLPLRAPGRAG